MLSHSFYTVFHILYTDNQSNFDDPYVNVTTNAKKNKKIKPLCCPVNIVNNPNSITVNLPHYHATTSTAVFRIRRR